MNIPYRTRRFLTRLGITVLVLAVIAIVVWLCWIIWVGRYMVYTPDGAKLDFSSLPNFSDGVLAEPPAPMETIEIVYDEPAIEETTPVVEKTSISGYYIDFEDLKNDIPAVKAKLQSLPAGTAVLLDVKNIKGYFHYSTAVGRTNSKDVNTAEMDGLLTWLADSDLYTIARLPAFRDWEYGLNNVPSGLPKKGGNGSLWMDDSNCYWLDPTDDGTLDYLIRITRELRSLGFDEVVYSDFRFPNTDKIVFEGSKSEAIAQAAAAIATACATDRFCISFISKEAAFALPDGNCRLYLEDIAAADIPDILDQVTTDDPANHLLFFTTVNDTRFDEFCVLRPLDSAH